MLYNIGEVHYHLGNNEEALTYLTQSLHISEKVGYQLIVTASLCVLGKVSLRQNKIDVAIPYLQKAIEVAAGIDSKLDVYQAQKALSLAYETKGDLVNAFEQYKLFHSVREDVFNHENLQRIKNIQFQHETLSIKKKRKRNV